MRSMVAPLLGEIQEANLVHGPGRDDRFDVLELTLQEY